MKSLWLCFSFFFILTVVSGQQRKLDSIALENTPDSLYREDQFYLGITFNALTDLPPGAEQSGFSGGFHTGVIRDMPINKRRNWSIGLGLGFSMNVYNNTLFIGETENGESIFKSINSRETNYEINRFSTFLVEAPLQLRWRTSSPDSYRFWRIYGGIRAGYIYHFKSRFQQIDNEVVQTKVPELNRIRYGATFTFGYNTFNFHVYYSLNSFFDENTTSQNPNEIGVATFKIGLMFYIL